MTRALGIEQLVANEIIVPPGGNPLSLPGIADSFTCPILNAYPSTYGPVDGLCCWLVSRLRLIGSELYCRDRRWWGTEESGYSTNGGQTWTPFASDPALGLRLTIGGTIAASTPRKYHLGACGRVPTLLYTSTAAKPGAPSFCRALPAGAGFDCAYYLDTRTVTADRVLANTFYLYYSGYGRL